MTASATLDRLRAASASIADARAHGAYLAPSYRESIAETQRVEFVLPEAAAAIAEPDTSNVPAARRLAYGLADLSCGAFAGGSPSRADPARLPVAAEQTAQRRDPVEGARSDLERDLAEAQRRIADLEARLDERARHERALSRTIDTIAATCKSTTIDQQLKPMLIALTIAAITDPRLSGMDGSPRRLYVDQARELAGLADKATASGQLKRLDKANIIALYREPLPPRVTVTKDGRRFETPRHTYAVTLDPPADDGSQSAPFGERVRRLAFQPSEPVQRRGWGGRRYRCAAHPDAPVTVHYECAECHAALGTEILNAHPGIQDGDHGELPRSAATAPRTNRWWPTADHDAADRDGQDAHDGAPGCPGCGRPLADGGAICPDCRTAAVRERVADERAAGLRPVLIPQRLSRPPEVHCGVKLRGSPTCHVCHERVDGAA